MEYPIVWAASSITGTLVISGQEYITRSIECSSAVGQSLLTGTVNWVSTVLSGCHRLALPGRCHQPRHRSDLYDYQPAAPKTGKPDPLIAVDTR